MPPRARNFIETVWGRGYVLREPHEVEETHSRLITGLQRGRSGSRLPDWTPPQNGGVFVFGD